MSIDKNCPPIKFVGQHGVSYFGHKRPKMLKNSEWQACRVDTILGQCVTLTSHRTTMAIFIATVSSFLIAIFIDLAPTYQGILITACTFHGFSSGLWISTAPQVLISLLGESHFEKAFSLMTFMRGVASVITQPFAEQMAEVAELPNLPLYLAAIYFALSTIALFIGTRRQEEEQTEENLQVP